MCWCAIEGTGGPCSSGEDYSIDVGEMLVLGPVRQDRTCISGQACHLDWLLVLPSPATHAILTVLKAGESVFQLCY